MRFTNVLWHTGDFFQHLSVWGHSLHIMYVEGSVGSVPISLSSMPFPFLLTLVISNEFSLLSLHYPLLCFLPIFKSLWQFFCFPTQEAMWCPGIIWGCVIIIALLPGPCSHGFSCLVSSMPILWLDLLSSGAKNTRITVVLPLTLWSLVHCLTATHMWHMSLRECSHGLCHYDPTPNLITSFWACEDP